MTNLDAIKQKKDAIRQRMFDAIANSDTEAFQKAYDDMSDMIGEGLRAEFEQYRADADAAILAQRGVRQLTSKERTFYEALIGAMKSDNPQQAFTGIDKTYPETVIDAVFDDLEENHPLLSKINFQRAGLLTKIIVSSTGGKASWQELGSEVVDELNAEFIEIDLGMAQVTAYIPVKRYMLDMGPAWLDRYVRGMLSEAIALEVERGIVVGTGKNEPIGMTKALTGAVDGVYQDKAVGATITTLDAAAYGVILDKLSQTRNDHRRPVSRVLMLVNPADYFTKVYPATTVRTTDGGYNSNTLPFPTDTIQSVAVPQGKAIFGIGDKYFMALGTAGKAGTIEYSDQYHLLKLERVYMTYFYGNGMPLDDNAFVVADISGIKPSVLDVRVIERTED
jgi:HK97 family phage major capsid protein